MTLPLRISGVARRPDGGTGGVVVRRVVLSARGQELGRIEALEPFELVLDGSDRVRVELASGALLEPLEVSRGTWAELGGAPDLEALRGRAPGPHVEVEVERTCVEDGVQVELLASDAEHVFEPGAGHRTAPARRLVRVTARALAYGPNASAEIDRLLAAERASSAKREETKQRQEDSKRPKPVTSRANHLPTPAAVGFTVAALLAVAALALPVSPLAFDLGTIGIAVAETVTIALFLWRVPRFVSGQKSIDDVKRSRALGFAVMGVVPLAFMWIPAIADDASNLTRHPRSTLPFENASLVSCVALAVWSIVCIVVVALALPSARRILGVLASTARLPVDRYEGTWGAVEGVVRDPSPVHAEGQACALVHVVEETVTPGSAPNILVERVLSNGTFFVDGDDGRTYEVRPKDGVWASSVWIDRPKLEGSREEVVRSQVIPVGGAVLVVGRATRARGSEAVTLASTGPESLLFFAAPRATSARRAVRRTLRAHRLLLGLSLACAGAGGLLAALSVQMLPPFHMSGPSAD